MLFKIPFEQILGSLMGTCVILFSDGIIGRDLNVFLYADFTGRAGCNCYRDETRRVNEGNRLV